MSVLTKVTRALQRVLIEDAQHVARTSGAIQRQRKLTGPALVQGLVLGWLKNPNATIEQLAQSVSVAGVNITTTALSKRFHEKLAGCFQQLVEVALQQAIRGQPLAAQLLQRFEGVYLLDGTVLILPDVLQRFWAGCGGDGSAASIKLQVRLNLLHGDLALVSLPGKTHEQKGALATAKLPAGALRLCDLGYFQLAKLQQFTEEDVWWITRIPCGTTITDSEGRPLDVTKLLSKRETTGELDVRLGAATNVAARLIIRCVSKAEAERRRAQARKAAAKHGQQISRQRLAWCQFDVLATNLPPDKLTADEAWVLAGARWQIEMLFKLWKSYGQLAHSRSENPWRIVTEMYAKLLGLLFSHWLLLTSHWQVPHRSWFKALRVVQDHALLLASALRSLKQLERVCRQIQSCFALNCYTNIRNKSPTTYQRLENPTLIAP